MEPTSYSNLRYLASKKTVDDRSLNKEVVERLRVEVASLDDRVPRVLEIGAGLGDMIARLADWDVLTRAEYFMLDVDGEILEASRDRLVSWAKRQGHTAECASGVIRIRGGGGIDLTIRTIHAELGDFLDRGGPTVPRADLLIANAVLDLIDLPSTLPRLLDLVVPAGLFWFSINYDGDTIFQPEHDADHDFMRVYNRSMDLRFRHGRPAGDSQTGRHLFRHLARAHASILAAGASDWVVFARNARYDADEAYFLHHIVRTIDGELSREPERRPEIAPLVRTDWVALRHAQIEAGDLVYIAHQIDFVGRRQLATPM
jgi:hypothetical protein